VKQLKRGGRGHEPSGIEGTGPGELLVKCRCCPQPGYNLPNDWEKAPPEKAYVHFHVFKSIIDRMQLVIYRSFGGRCQL
jgi:hypothetical protein